MKLIQKIKIECIKKNISITEISNLLGLNSSQLLYYHIKRENPKILSKIEEILKLEAGTFLK